MELLLFFLAHVLQASENKRSNLAGSASSAVVHAGLWIEPFADNFTQIVAHSLKTIFFVAEQFIVIVGLVRLQIRLDALPRVRSFQIG